MWLRDNPRFESHFGDEPNDDAGDDGTKKKARPRGRDKAKHAQAQKKAIDIIKNKVTCAVKDIVDVGTRRGNASDDLREILAKGIQTITDTTKQMVTNQVMKEVDTPKRKEYFRNVQANAKAEVNVKKRKLELEEGKLALKEEELKLKRLGKHRLVESYVNVKRIITYQNTFLSNHLSSFIF